MDGINRTISRNEAMNSESRDVMGSLCSVEFFEARVPFVIKVMVLIAPALAPCMGITGWAVHKRFMSVPNFIEEVDLVFLCE